MQDNATSNQASVFSREKQLVQGDSGISSTVKLVELLNLSVSFQQLQMKLSTDSDDQELNAVQTGS